VRFVCLFASSLFLLIDVLSLFYGYDVQNYSIFVQKYLLNAMYFEFCLSFRKKSLFLQSHLYMKIESSIKLYS
jgi:hypothetical protein